MDQSEYLNLLRQHRDEHPNKIGPLSGLFGLEIKNDRVPFDAWLAVILSYEAGVPVAEWVYQTFKDIYEDYAHARLRSIDSAFGFKSNPGKTPEVHRRLAHVRNEGLCVDIWKLNMLGYSIDQACRMVAQRFQQEGSKAYDDCAFELRPKRGKGEFYHRLRAIFFKWKKDNRDSWIPFATDRWKEWLAAHGEEFSKQYPDASDNRHFAKKTSVAKKR